MSTISDAHQPNDLAPSGLLKILEGNPKRLGRIRFLGNLFKSHGFELRIAGGAVRDILRGREPQDIDFATTARPEETLAMVNKHEDLLRIIVTTAGQRHGTVAVKFKETEIDLAKRIKLSNTGQPDERPAAAAAAAAASSRLKEPEYDDESPYEITTLRCDRLTDGRHAEVEFVNDWRVDAERRDLTINAMFLTLDEGKLVDYFNGEHDLNEGIVRFVGDADHRIREDYLRILRFFRFWSRYSRGRKPDADTLSKLKNNIQGLDQISGERMWQELKKIFSHLPCVGVVQLMLELKVFDYFGLNSDELTDYKAYTQAVVDELGFVQENVQKYARDFLEPQLQRNARDQGCKRLKELLPVILFATVVQSEGLCLNAYKRARFSNLERDTILYIIENRAEELGAPALKYHLAMAPAPERHQIMQKIKALIVFKGKFELIDELESWEVPTFPLSGTVVAKAVKERRLPGKRTRDLLEAVKQEWAKQDYRPGGDQLTAIMREKLEEISREQTPTSECPPRK